MICRDQSILNLLKTEKLKILPVPTQEQIQPASVDLRLGNEYLAPIVMEHSIDIRNTEPKYQPLNGNAITIPPNEFILATTKEWVEIPEDYSAFVVGRSSIARLGIQVECAGFVDAGFKGNITLELKNQSPNSVTLHEDLRICQLILFQLDGIPKRVYGEVDNKYQGQTGVTGSMIYWDTDNQHGAV